MRPREPPTLPRPSPTDVRDVVRVWVVVVIDSFRDEYAFLSNFSPSLIEHGWITYPTVEHFFQAAKTPDHASKLRIATASTPSRAKYAGRSVALRSNWESVKLDVMREGLALKFATDSPLARRLLDTGSHLLREGNTWGDRYWGTVDGHGLNWLGHLLMARRAELADLQ